MLYGIICGKIGFWHVFLLLKLEITTHEAPIILKLGGLVVSLLCRSRSTM